jgi:hypothetical protein
MMRTIFASNETANLARGELSGRIEIFSFFPYDRGDCECRTMISAWQRELSTLPENERKQKIRETGHFTCPRSKAGMRRYVLRGSFCNQVMGYVWATDNKLSDWCDFHYTQWTDGEKWYGCLTPNISPIDQTLGLECTCGVDSRDFRANTTLSKVVAESFESRNRIGREFGKQDSKFVLAAVPKSVNFVVPKNVV